MMLEKLHKWKNEIRLHFYTIRKNYWKWIKELKERPETIKLLEENIGSKLSDIRQQDKKISSWDYIRLKGLTKESINKMKSVYWMKENICISHT